MTPKDKITVSPLKLFNIAYKTFLALGMCEEDARLAADVLNVADRRGVDTHGLNRMYLYINQINGGAASVNVSIDVIKESPSTLFLEGNNSLGIVGAPKAMRMTVDKAKKSGICFTVLRHTGHFGAAAYYSLMAANEGLIGCVTSGGVPIMAPTGGRKGILNNLPVSIAFPAGTHYPYPVLVDMACSEVAGGKLELARRAGDEVPLTWFVDREGKPCSDPNEFFKSLALMPFGGAKGYCLAVMLDLLSSVMSGAGFDGDVTIDDTKEQNIGISFLAIDPSYFLPKNEFISALDRYTRMIKNCPPAVGVKEVLLPGEIEQMTTLKYDVEGVCFDKKLALELVALLKNNGVLLENAGIDELLNL